MQMTRKELFEFGGKTLLAAGASRLGFFSFLDMPRGFAEDVLKSETVKRIHTYISDHKQEHIAKIQEFLKQPSVSSWNMGIKECAEMLVSYFKTMGCKEANLVPTAGLPGVWAYYDAGAPRTVSHYMMYDTQPFDEKRWSSPPLEARLVKMAPFEQVIMARGAINSKGPLRAFLNACESIIAVTGKLPVNIMFTCDGEEEQGSPNFHEVLKPYLNRLKTCSAHLDVGPSQNRDGHINMYLGNKGIAYVELECHGKRWGRGPQKMPIHSSRKAILDSPVWRLSKALSSMVSEDGNRVLIEDFYSDIVPPTAEEEMLVHTLINKYGNKLFASERENVKAWINNMKDPEAIRHLCFDTTLNIDGIWGGYTGPGSATILPEKAAAKLDCRLVPNQQIDKQIGYIRRHLDRHGFSDLELRKFGGGDEWSRTSVKAPVVQAVLSVYQQYGLEPAIWPRSAGSSPQAQYTRPPLNLAGASGGLGHGGRAHSDDEYFVIEGNEKVHGLVKCEQSMVDILYAYANWPE